MRSKAETVEAPISRNFPGRAERGTTVVEFAVIAALVLAIVFGILEYGLIFLQEHYVADAAREGARIGVRANNYDCYKGVRMFGVTTCTSDRETRVIAAVRDYLDVLYDAEEVTVTILSTDIDATEDGGEILRVSVQTPNFCPPLTVGLLKLLRSGSDARGPTQIAFTASMEYEDHKEYIPEP